MPPQARTNVHPPMSRARLSLVSCVAGPVVLLEQAVMSAMSAARTTRIPEFWRMYFEVIIGRLWLSRTSRRTADGPVRSPHWETDTRDRLPEAVRAVLFTNHDPIPLSRAADHPRRQPVPCRCVQPAGDAGD